MKRTFSLLTLVLYFALLPQITLRGQDFKLWFANNVSDVKDLENITSSPELNWREAKDGDLAGNQAEVYQIQRMLASTNMKGLAQQQQFWTMRDHSLLCFRIGDIDDKTHDTYEVEVEDVSSGEKQSLTVTKYFFVNAPLRVKPSTEYAITVKKVGNRGKSIRFRYFAYDWNNDNLYIFQLDRKRQLSGKGYSLEYVTGYMDEDGYVHKETVSLPLREKSFQSFYLPEGRDLMDVILVGDENKLRINKNRLHPRIDLENRFNLMRLSPEFNLDRHQGREFINFNWLGSGLFEKYDTLHLTLFNQRSQPIRSATINVEQVDENGRPTHSRAVKYLGYDTKSKTHCILTMGKPAYIEILASGSYPTVYRYAGAADEETGLVNEDRCSVELTLRSGRWSKNDLVISSNRFLNLNDERHIIVRNGVDHRLCSIQEMELTGRAPVDTISYLVDCGHSFPKLLDNKPIDRFAQLEITFSRPKGGTTPMSTLTCTPTSGGSARQAEQMETIVVSANDFRSFSRDYYFVRYSLLDAIQKGEVSRLTLQAGDISFDKFPMLCSSDFNRNDAKKLVEKFANENATGASSSNAQSRLTTHNFWDKPSLRRVRDGWGTNTEDEEDFPGIEGFGAIGLDISLPIKLKFNCQPVTISTSINYDFIRQILSFGVIGEFNRSDTGHDASQEMRKEVKDDERKEFIGNETVGGNFTADGVAVDSWVYDDIDDIFDLSSNHVGAGWFGGFGLTLRTPILDWKRFQITEARGTVGLGAGGAWNFDEFPPVAKLKELLEKTGGWVDFSFGAVAEVNFEGTLGIHSYDPNFEESSMTGKTMGFFLRIGPKLKAGVTAEISVGKDSLSFIGNFKAGLRAGIKAGGFFGLDQPFAAYAPGWGFRVVGMGMGQAYFNAKLFCLHASGSGGFRVGGQWLWPNNDHNPFHKDFPYWLNTEVRSVGNAFRKIAAPEPSEYGRELVNDVAIDANPHFLDGSTVVYNDLRKPKDYNDDRIVVYNTQTKQKEDISDQLMSATGHMRSKRGEHEVVVFEQMTKQLDNDAVTDQTALAASADIMKTKRIRAAFRDGNGAWRTTYVTGAPGSEDDGMTDLNPVVTIQDDGKAACIYRHGKMTLEGSAQPLSDAEREKDPLGDVAKLKFDGELMLRTFDGNKWSEPTTLFYDDSDNFLGKYDLIMRDDTVLVAAMFGVNVEGFEKKRMIYASKPLNKEWASYIYDPLDVRDFFMSRVGQNAVVAMTYEPTDSIRDIYVKTLDMDGTNDGRMGCDLGLDRCHPANVKIICDRSATKLDDFAVLWTEVNNSTRQQDGSTATGEMRTMLNASRIHLTNAPQYTAPITLGAEVDSVLILTDYDGFLDDDSISVVYTLADVKSGAAVIMRNGKVFTNSFEHEVSYTNQALLSSSALPVNIQIRNTGTSAIESVVATINGEKFNIPDSYVAPRKIRNFTVQYPISDDFDGYITSTVDVTYNNIFKHNKSRGFKARSNVRQSSPRITDRVSLGNVDCTVMSQTIEEGANTFLVELNDLAGMRSDMAVCVGIYAHPSGTEPITDEAEVIVPASEFVQMADARKAYATVTVSGITEPIKAYVNARVVEPDDKGRSRRRARALYRVSTRSDQWTGVASGANGAVKSSPSSVNLFPSDDPGEITRIAPIEAGAENDHRISIAREDGGVRLSGLVSGEQVRIFSADGRTVFSKKVDATTMMVPLHLTGVYLLSSDSETYKFKY